MLYLPIIAGGILIRIHRLALFPPPSQVFVAIDEIFAVPGALPGSNSEFFQNLSYFVPDLTLSRGHVVKTMGDYLFKILGFFSEIKPSHLPTAEWPRQPRDANSFLDPPIRVCVCVCRRTSLISVFF